MNAFEERLRAAGWDDELFHAEPGTLHHLTYEQLQAYLDTPAAIPSYRSVAEDSGMARGIYVGEDPDWNGLERFTVVDGRNPFEPRGSWGLLRIAEKAALEPWHTPSLMGLDRLLSSGTPEPGDDRGPLGPEGPGLDQDLYNERAGVYVVSRVTHEDHQVLDCYFGVSPEKAARAWEISQTEQDDPRYLTIATVEDAFGSGRARIDRDDPADRELVELLVRNVSAPGLGWVGDKDIVQTLGRIANEPRREGNLRAMKDYAEAVWRAACDYPDGLMRGTNAETRILGASHAIGNVRSAKSAQDVSWSDIESIADCGGWLRMATGVSALELALEDPELLDLDAPGVREGIAAFTSHECDLSLSDPFRRAQLDEAKARTEELGDRMPMTRDEMSYWYMATEHEVHSAATTTPEGPGWSLMLKGGAGYLSEEKQRAILGDGWKADAFCRLDGAKAEFGLEAALDAWARHPGDPNWIADVPGWNDEMLTYEVEFLPEDFEPGGAYFDDRGADPDEVVAHARSQAEGPERAEMDKGGKGADAPDKTGAPRP